MTPEIQAKISLWRTKAAAGKLTDEEMAEAILVLRAGRVNAAAASEKSRSTRTRKPAEIPNADDLLAELDGEGETE